MIFFPLPGIFFRCTCNVCGDENRSSRFEEQLVDVAPGPFLTRLEGLNDRMGGRVEMLGGVRILRSVAATDMSTAQTQAQVHPAITHFQAILAPSRAWRDVTYLVEMMTLLCHVFVPSLINSPYVYRHPWTSRIPRHFLALIASVLLMMQFLAKLVYM